MSLDEDVDTNKELVAHGYSNFVAGIFGTVYVIRSSLLRFQLTVLRVADLIILYM